jgi:hypothetical protein
VGSSKGKGKPKPRGGRGIEREFLGDDHQYVAAVGATDPLIEIKDMLAKVLKGLEICSNKKDESKQVERRRPTPEFLATIECYRCGVKGHMRSVCCQECSEGGHEKWNCPKKKQKQPKGITEQKPLN